MENNLVNYVFNVDKAKHHTCRLQPYTKSRSNNRYSKTNKQSAPKADFNTQNLLIEMQGLNIEYDDNLKLTSEDTTIHSNVGKLTGKIQQLNIVENENSKENDASYLNVDQPNTRRPRYIKHQDKCFQCRKKFRVFFNNDYGELQLCDAVLKHGDCYHETCAM
ncbi:hypothetical protein Ahia01_000327100 [Argonauta hians]